MKTFLEHLFESDKEYHFRIKTIVPLDDAMLDRVERVLRKYELRDFKGPTKTIFQDHPLDFSDISAAEVFIIDVVIGVPQSSYILQQELRDALSISEKFIVVRGDNEPLEVETQRMRMQKEIANQANEKGLKKSSLLDTDSTYSESEFEADGAQFFGNEHVSKFLNTLATVASSRNSPVVEPKSGLFNWLKDAPKADVELDDTTFNTNIQDAPKVVPWWKVKSESNALEDNVSIQGNLDDDSEERHVNYLNQRGTKKVLSSKSDNMRK
ncbi:MAG: hypothetical protein HC836_32830 [Richelia sp. RM2_1_2]|nr:hypothetical protein [Richelia sp. RM2_1_2]